MHETMPDDGEGREAGLAFLAQARALLAASLDAVARWLPPGQVGQN